MSVCVNTAVLGQQSVCASGASGWGLRALDSEFDAAVITLANTVLPDGYEIADDAPSTLEELVAHIESGRRLRVWSGASGLTIYGSAEVNFAFRAWHDWHHWKGRHPFTFEGEAAVAWRQAQQLREMFGGHPRERVWRGYVFAEVIGQGLRADLEGEFPGNQRRFVERLVEVLLEPEALIPPAAATRVGPVAVVAGVVRGRAAAA